MAGDGVRSARHEVGLVADGGLHVCRAAGLDLDFVDVVGVVVDVSHDFGGASDGTRPALGVVRLAGGILVMDASEHADQISGCGTDGQRAVGGQGDGVTIANGRSVRRVDCVGICPRLPRGVLAEQKAERRGSECHGSVLIRMWEFGLGALGCQTLRDDPADCLRCLAHRGPGSP